MSRRRITLDEVKPNVVDKVVSYFNPKAGLQRFRARYQAAIAGAYVGASKKRRGTKSWNTSAGDADSDVLVDLPTLRERSRDLVRNAPIATGAIHTKCTNIVGAGLRLHCRIDRDFLGMSDEQADAWETNTQREFRLWAESQDCSADRMNDFYEQQDLALRSTLENGDTFALLPMIERKGNPYTLAVQLVEADRVCNKDNKADTEQLAGGIQRDTRGAATHVHVMRSHPGDYRDGKKQEWDVVPLFGVQSGRRNVLHIFRRLRIGQSRGVPDLAPVIETIKQISTYTDAEISAAVVSGMFTVFVQAEGGLNPLESDGSSSSSASDAQADEIKLGPGAIVDLAENESVHMANPTRPNSGFDPFMMSILRQVGVALEIPLELLIMHFTASYSASMAALEMAWKAFKSRRQWLASRFCQPIYAEWLAEAVTLGRIAAPGFLSDDPAVRAAYLGAVWIGPARGNIQKKQEMEGEQLAVDMGAKTLDAVVAETTGEDWENVHRQRVKEVRARKDDGLEGGGKTAGPAQPPAFVEDPDDQDSTENDNRDPDDQDNNDTEDEET